MDVKPPPGGHFTVYSAPTVRPTAVLVFTVRKGLHLGPGSLENAVGMCRCPLITQIRGQTSKSSLAFELG